jgi:hypothetical protein
VELLDVLGDHDVHVVLEVAELELLGAGETGAGGVAGALENTGALLTLEDEPQPPEVVLGGVVLDPPEVVVDDVVGVFTEGFIEAQELVGVFLSFLLASIRAENISFAVFSVTGAEAKVIGFSISPEAVARMRPIVLPLHVGTPFLRIFIASESFNTFPFLRELIISFRASLASSL